MPERAQRSNFTRLAHSTHWDYGNIAVLHFLRKIAKHGSIYSTGTDDIDPDLSFESAVQVRAKERTAALLALTRDNQEIPSLRL